MTFNKEEIFNLLIKSRENQNNNDINIDNKPRLTKNEEYLLNMINDLKEENNELRNKFDVVINKYDSLIKSLESSNNEIRNEIILINDKNKELETELNNEIITNSNKFNELKTELGTDYIISIPPYHSKIINIIPKNIDKILFHYNKNVYDGGNINECIKIYYNNCYFYYLNIEKMLSYNHILNLKIIFEKINIQEIYFNIIQNSTTFTLNEQIEIVEHYLLTHPNKNTKLSINFNDKIDGVIMNNNNFINLLNTILENLEKYNNFSLIIEIDQYAKIRDIKNEMYKFKNIDYNIIYNITEHYKLYYIPNEINYKISIKYNDIEGELISKLKNNNVSNKNIIVIIGIVIDIKTKDNINNILEQYKTYFDNNNINISIVYE